VVETVKGKIEFGEETAQSGKYRHRTGSNLGKGNSVNEGDRGGNVGNLPERDWHNRSCGPPGDHCVPLVRGPGVKAGRSGGATRNDRVNQSRNPSGQSGSSEVLQARHNEVEYREPRLRTEFEDGVPIRGREMEVEVELAGQGGHLAGQTEHVPGD